MENAIGKWSILVVWAIMLVSGPVSAEDRTFTVVVDRSIHGTVRIDPPPPADGKYGKGSVIAVTAVPDAGYALDSCYFSAPGMYGPMFYESTASPCEVTVDREMHVGASFIEKSEVDHLNVIQNVVYARPGVKTLKYDVYIPKGAKDLPMIVIIHGGGWAPIPRISCAEWPVN